MSISPSSKNLSFETLTVETIEECLNIIADAFDVDEPVNSSLPVPKTIFRLFLNDHSSVLLKYQDFCFCARDKSTGKIVAAFLNYDSSEQIPMDTLSVVPTLPEAFEFLYHYKSMQPELDENVAVAARKEMTFGFSGVHEDYRGLGLQSSARKLLIDAARNSGYTHVISAASSCASQRSMVKLGAVEKSRLVYKDWSNSQGVIAFAAAPEHHVAWCIMELQI